MNVLLMGVSVFFTIVSAYVVGLYAFLWRGPVVLRTFAFLFFTLVIGILGYIYQGALNIHDGLLETLRDLRDQGALSPAGAAALANTEGGLDETIQRGLWFAAAAFYLGIFWLTFFVRRRAAPA